MLPWQSIRRTLCAAAAIFACSSALGAGGNARLTAQQWRDDLHTLASAVATVHPDAFHRVRKEEFDSTVERLDHAIPGLSDHAIEAQFVRLIAMLGEGHSRISLPGLPDPLSDVADITPFRNAGLAFHRLPIRLRLFSDGLFVTDATRDYASLVGARVIRIGKRTAADAMASVLPYANRDNDMGGELLAPVFAGVPEILRASATIDDESRVPLVVQTPNGGEAAVALTPLPAGSEPAWTGSTVLPLYLQHALQHADRNLWQEYLSDSRTLYIRIHVLQDSAGESVAQFAADADSVASAHAPARTVIDLRGCHGGDNQKVRALLLAIVRNERLNWPGRLFVLTDRETFSAAVNALTDFERLANAIFVGEAPAGSPNSWGDPKRIELPNSGLIARISTVYWRDWTGDAARAAFAPDLTVAANSADYFGGRDAAMATVLQFPPGDSFGDVLENLSHAGAGMRTMLRLYYQHKTDPRWANESTEAAMQQLGKGFLARKAYDDALLVFRINARDYPASLETALANARAAQASAPEDTGIGKLVDALAALKKN